MTSTMQNLKNIGLVNVVYPNEPRIAVENAVASWKKFCSLPKETKHKFPFIERHADGTGYELKEEKGARKDLKENFQITLADFERIQNIAQEIQDPEAIAFIHCAHELIRLIEPVVMQFAQATEKTYGIQGMAEEVLKAKDLWIFRYLHYFNDRPPGEEIAAAHLDKAAFTLHLYESHGGLQYLDKHTRRWQEMPVGDGQTVVIPAMQLQLQSKGDLKALYHRVVATEETSRTGRFSMVCFVPMLGAPLYNKSAKGRMQHYDVGFNYDISHHDFSELFHKN